MERYIVKPEDLIGEIEGFPIEVVQKMVDCQFEQKKSNNISIFQKCNIDGFTWTDSKEGVDFWIKVIVKKNFDLFFEKYPKSKN